MTIAGPTRQCTCGRPARSTCSSAWRAAQPDGYHDVATAYQAVSLYEDVRAWNDDEFSVSVRRHRSTPRASSTDGSNLAIKAAKLLARTAGVPGGVRLEIEKNVPIAGGMGGGSADAAATLVACDALWGTALLEGGAARARREARRRRAVRPHGRHGDRHRVAATG